MRPCSPTSSARRPPYRAAAGSPDAIRDKYKVATVAEFGPRFLHSTGQAYKGGPNSGVFLQITADDAADLPVPGEKYTFSVVKAAQARGDFDVLAERGRRALRVHITGWPGGRSAAVKAAAIHGCSRLKPRPPLVRQPASE